MQVLKVKKLSTKAILPTRSHADDAGLDLYASEDVFIPVGATGKIPTDVAVCIDPGYYAQIADRSGCALKALRTGGGIIDSSYRGNVCVILHNLSNESSRNQTRCCDGILGYQVYSGDKIAQMIIHKIELPVVEEVQSLESTSRGESGFGSTGR